jgi:hypothetical protein
VNEDRLTRRQMLAILVTGLITAGIALVATIFVIGTIQPTWKASAQLALVPGKQLPAADQPSYWESLSGGQAGRIAAEVLNQSTWKTAAAQAANVAPEQLTIVAGVVDSTNLINVTAETTSSDGAVASLQKLLTDATPTVQNVAGPFAVTVVQEPAGTAVASSLPKSQLLIVVFIGGLLVGSGAALIIARARRKSDDEPEFYDTGEFRAAQAGGYRPQAGGPPRGPNGPGGPPMPPYNNGGPNGQNGAYAGPPRRPANDPRPNQPPR